MKPDCYSVASDIFDGAIDQLAYRFRSDLDLVNALELFERLGPDVLAYHRERQDLAIESGVPAFFSSFMPKSAGTYLHNSLVRAGAVDIFNQTQSPIDFYQAYLIHSWLKVFLRGGSSCHSHMRPTPHNRKIMQLAGVSRIWIHVRDPRQTALSSFWHGNGCGQGEGEHAERRLDDEEEARAHRARTMSLLGMAPLEAESFESRIKFDFTLMQQWAQDWVALSDAWLDMQFLFTTYEEMLADRPDFERRVLNFFQCSFDHPVFKNKEKEDRFRLGSISEWRDVYSANLVQWLEHHVDASIYQRFGWEI